MIEKHARIEEVRHLHDATGLAGIHRNIWQYWYKIWADNEYIIERMQLIDQIFEIKLLKDGAHGKMHAGRAMLVLRNKYGYVVPSYMRRKRRAMGGYPED